jgi:pimeloyl-ACP methyl ester carboxylesterase
MKFDDELPPFFVEFESKFLENNIGYVRFNAFMPPVHNRFKDTIKSAKWGARAAGPAEHKGVTSDVPTLILAGEFDQNTPSYWGKLAGETLNNSHYIEFPGTGHGVINNGSCALSVIKSFFDTPTSRPDDTCVRELTGPKFAMPETD